jgi:DinB superfamily
MTTPPTSAASATLYADLDEELAGAHRMLERYPDGKGSWRPHPKSRTLGELATHLAGIPALGTMIVEKDERQLVGGPPQSPPADSAAELLHRFEQGVDGFRKALGAVSEADLERTWTMRAGDRVLVSGKKRVLLRRMVVSHIVHHRAQLGVYYRLLDVPVPATLGPTADEPIG